MRRHCNDPQNLVNGCDPLESPQMLNPEKWPSFTQRMMYLDTVSYLPDGILTKVDRASMAVSLEARAPLLDTDLVEFVWHSPQEFKVQNGIGKYPMRLELAKYLPKDLIERPKMGFAVPIGDWLRGPLKGWADDLLETDLINRQGYLDSKAVQNIWHQHLRGDWSWQYLLWDILMFQSWLQTHHD